jgi:diguanylate cyclase (GGDEF)-like protein
MTIDILQADRLSDGFKHLDNNGVSLILSDLGLPDSQGLATIARICEKAPDTPVVVLTGIDDEELALGAVKAGAQDYLTKGQIDANLLARSMRYSIERHRLMRELKSLAITDELTDLYNRRGFLMLADKQKELAERVGQKLSLIYLDVDFMKSINDGFGHTEGDKALIDTAQVLRRTFRESDIIARIGGDEFAVLGLEGSEDMISRLQRNITPPHTREQRPYQLSVSIGLLSFDPTTDYDMHALLAEADRLMYEQKTLKRESGISRD